MDFAFLFASNCWLATAYLWHFSLAYFNPCDQFKMFCVKLLLYYCYCGVRLQSFSECCGSVVDRLVVCFTVAYVYISDVMLLVCQITISWLCTFSCWWKLDNYDPLSVLLICGTSYILLSKLELGQSVCDLRTVTLYNFSTWRPTANGFDRPNPPSAATRK